MTPTPGERIGPFELLSALGAGGMGEVFRARDTRLKRDVAIKVLPDAFAADADRLARFRREAELLATLNHPRIAAIYGLEDHGSSIAIVLELVEGDTLADRLAGGALPIDEALPIARQIAEALEAAHDRGVVHRDLKPANIKVSPDGVVKVLDFGLAKVMDAAPQQGSTHPSMSPTALTQAGFIMGTAAYMSPEQARGRFVDERADIWAFGCVLFEMVTGRRAFEAEDASLTLARVLEREVALASLPPALPSRVGRVIGLCLKKDPKQRISDIRDVRLMLDGAFDAGEPAHAALPPAPPPWWRTWWWLGAAATGAVLGALVVTALRPASAPPSPRVVRFSLPASESVAPRGAGTGRHVLALSPQSTHLVYWANELLHVRALDRVDGDVPLRGTEGAREPFFSPDGRWVGFFLENQLKRVSIDGGAPITIGAARNPFGVHWGADGAVRFGQGPDGIWMMPGSGGAATQLVKVEEGQLAHGPELLPGGDWLLFTLRGRGVVSWDQAQLVAQSIKTGERRVLVERGRDGRYVASGHLVYGLDGALLAVPFDTAGMRIAGVPVPLLEGVVDGDVRTGAIHFSVSGDGTLAYLAGGSGDQSSLAWVARDGRLQPLPAAPLSYGGPRVSPDGTRAAVDVERNGNFDVMVYDFARNMLTALASSPAREQFPAWSPDSRRVVFYSDADGGGLFWKAADGTGATERLTTQALLQLPSSWSPDRRTLLFHQTARTPMANIRQGDPGDIYALSLDRGNTVTPLVQTPAFEAQPTLSPDSKWLAYTASDGGARNVYVRPFPDVEAGRWQISLDGGFAPLWSPDGTWLYYTVERRAMGVPIETAPTFRPGKPTVLFELPPVYSAGTSSFWRSWDVAPDGERFLIVVPGGVGQSQVVVVLNWFEELKRLVPAK